MANTNFHVYVLFSPSVQNLIKVGRSNNLNRIRHLKEMCYGDIADWAEVAIIPVDSNQAAIAIESMVHARLANQGHRRPRFRWTNKKTSRISYADECFTCSPNHAVAVVKFMAGVYEEHVA